MITQRAHGIVCPFLFGGKQNDRRTLSLSMQSLGNSLISTNNMPRTLAELTGAEVVCHARGGARLSEQLSLGTRLGTRTHMALTDENWDYAVLQDRKENRCV